MKKQLLLFLFAIVVSVGTMFAWDYERVQIGELYYNLDATNQTAEVTYELYWDANNYKGLTTVNIPASVTYSGTTYSVTSIGYYAFRGCSGLTSVTIPNSVTSIENYAFWGCSGLTSVTIGNSVTSIGSHAFLNCSGLPVVDNLRYADTYLVEAVDKTLSSYTIKNGTKWIGGSAFSECRSLTSIEIPNSVTSIGVSAFKACSGLTSVEIPNSVTRIGEWAFTSCSGLTSLSVEAGNTVYDSRNNCNAIIETSTNTLIFGCQNTTIPNSVTSIGGSAFEGCSSLTSVTIPNSVTSIGDCAFEACSGLTSVTIPNSVKTLGYRAFANCSVLNHVEFPNSIEDCAHYVFDNCPDIVTPIYNSHVFAYLPVSYTGAYTIPDGIKIVAGGSFAFCNNLTSVSFPNSVKSIKAQAFYQCSNLEDVSFGDNLEIIEHGAFYGCSKLSDVHFPNSLKSINGNDQGFPGAFGRCSSLTSIIIPDSVYEIGALSFDGCSNLESVILGNGVINIHRNAFSNCSGLTSVTIPNSVTSIGWSAFADCTGLISIICEAITPPTLDNLVFDNVDKSIPLYVLAASIDTYKAADGWKEFTNILPIGGMDIDHPTNPGTYQLTLNASIAGAGVLTGAGMYAQGTEVSVSATANTGYTFERWSDGVTDASRTIILVKDSTLTAIFSINHYTITFVDEDGTTVLSSDEYDYGATPVAPADPSKAATAQYTYTFTGWSPAIATVTGTATYTATYSQTVNKYTITFVDEDGTTVLASAEYEYGATPVAPADPSKAATAQYTYTFAGWSPEIAAVTGAATYTAIYSQIVNKYTVTFVDEDGTTILASSEYDYGATPVAPADPTKAATAQYTYTFAGWSPEIAAVTGAATYTATYSQTTNKYTITFVDEDGTTVLSSAEYEYGATPVAPADPTKAATEEYTYTFSGWDKTIAVVTEAATYTATYSSQLNNVAVTGDQDLADLPVGENTHITVGEDGNLTVSEPTTIGTITVTVNGDEASEIIGVENLTVTNAEMILRLEPNKANATPNKWYAFGVPFEVEVSGGIYAQGSASPAIYNSAFVLDEYDGSLRASTQQGWKRVASSAVLQPGVLYMIAVGRTTNEWRFVKRASASLTEQTSLSVAAYPSAIGAHHAGWNGLANTLFRDASVVLDGVQYITTYNNEQSVYEVQPIADATLAMAKPFFVQVPQAGTLHLTAQPAGVAARSLMAADELTPSCVLSLSSADFTDRAYVTAQVGKENTYSIGHDLMKMLDGTPSVPQLWLEGYNLRLAAYELALTSESTTVIIPLGLYAPQNGTYTLDAETQSDYYTLTLLADDTPVAELGEQTVSIELEQGNNSKYALCITKKADVVTNIINGTADGTQVVKFVQDDLLYILRDGKTYTIQGVEVK